MSRKNGAQRKRLVTVCITFDGVCECMRARMVGERVDERLIACARIIFYYFFLLSILWALLKAYM